MFRQWSSLEVGGEVGVEEYLQSPRASLQAGRGLRLCDVGRKPFSKLVQWELGGKGTNPTKWKTASQGASTKTDNLEGT